jgi:periplasmic divalent cation tolerance protein
MTDCIVVLVTAKDEDEASCIARVLVEKKLAACCNIVSGVRSIYQWEGAIADEREVLMIIKSRRELFASLEAEVRRRHSYSTPEIIALPITAGSEAYLNWIKQST